MASIYNAQDIQIPDINDRIDYYRKFVSGDIEGAKDIYESNPNLVGKCVNAEMFNQLLSEIVSLETDYKLNVTDFLEAQYDKYQININHFVYMQEYDDATQYEVNNLVTLGEDIYFCYVRPPVGTNPSDSDYWIKLNVKGFVGCYELNVKYVGAWSQSKTYVVKDMVVYNNELYVAKSSVSAGVVPTNTTYWLKAVTIEPRLIFVSSTEPTNIQTSDIWIKIL